MSQTLKEYIIAIGNNLPLKIPMKVSPSYEDDCKVQFKETLALNQRMNSDLTSTQDINKITQENNQHLPPKKFLKISSENGPKSRRGKTMPRIAMMTSGGGFRAMIAHSGAYKV